LFRSDGQPSYCNLILGVDGLLETTVATVSQPVTFRTEFDLNSPLSDGTASAHTTLDGIYGPSIAGYTGTSVGSAYLLDGYGDNRNTGWAVLQPTNALPTTNLFSGSVQGYAGPMANLPYLSLNVAQTAGDGIGFTVGYICCTPCPTNCLQVQCPTNKTVECGTNWTFDLPAASSCCGGTVTIKSTSIVTNGTCPKYITNNWQIYDNCGNTDTCQHVVTVVDTTPPNITCPTNVVVVSLNTNCQLVIPAIGVTASDNCTPLCSLVYTQSPTNGTIVSGTNAYVTVTVTDLCGNSSQCTVHVEGVPRKSLQVT